MKIFISKVHFIDFLIIIYSKVTNYFSYKKSTNGNTNDADLKFSNSIVLQYSLNTPVIIGSY